MTARLDLRLPADLKHNLALEAARDNRTVSAVTVLAIREYLDRRDLPSKAQKDRADE